MATVKNQHHENLPAERLETLGLAEKGLLREGGKLIFTAGPELQLHAEGIICHEKSPSASRCHPAELRSPIFSEVHIRSMLSTAAACSWPNQHSCMVKPLQENVHCLHEEIKPQCNDRHESVWQLLQNESMSHHFSSIWLKFQLEQLLPRGKASSGLLLILSPCYLSSSAWAMHSLPDASAAAQ